jgi:hypothetical protein
MQGVSAVFCPTAGAGTARKFFDVEQQHQLLAETALRGILWELGWISLC